MAALSLRVFGSVPSLHHVPSFLRLAAKSPDEFINANRVHNCLGNCAPSGPTIPESVSSLISTTRTGAFQWYQGQDSVHLLESPFMGSEQDTTGNLMERFQHGVLWAAKQFSQYASWVLIQVSSLMPSFRIAIILGGIVIVLSMAAVYFYYKHSIPNPQLETLQSNPVSDNVSCVICMDEVRSHVFIPCGHMVTCKNCAFKEDLKNCPVCMRTIEQAIKLYCP